MSELSEFSDVALVLELRARAALQERTLPVNLRRDMGVNQLAECNRNLAGALGALSALRSLHQQGDDSPEVAQTS